MYSVVGRSSDNFFPLLRNTTESGSKKAKEDPSADTKLGIDVTETLVRRRDVVVVVVVVVFVGGGDGGGGDGANGTADEPVSPKAIGRDQSTSVRSSSP